jgi:hypothetical protein
MAVKKEADATRLMPTYFTAPSSCSRALPRTSNTNEAIRSTSNQTYMLKMSPVMNAPLIPISRSWKRMWNPKRSRASSMPARA